MGARVLVFCLAIMFSFAFACTAARAIASALRHRASAMRSQGIDMTPANLVSWRLRNGYQLLVPLARVPLSNARIAALAEEAVRAFEMRDISTDEEKLLSVFLAGASFLSIVVGVATSSPIAPLAVLACCVVAAVMAIGHHREKMKDAARDAVPAALESMASCFGSGFTLQQTFEQVAHDIEGPLSATFRRSAHILEMGGGSDRALRELWNGSHATELAFVAVALDIQHQSGGSMRQVLEAASETVKGELALRRSLRVQTAQAQLSARVVALMPLVLISIFSLISPDFLAPFFQSVQGYALLSLAVIMQVAGIVLVRKTLSVEGVS